MVIQDILPEKQSLDILKIIDEREKWYERKSCRSYRDILNESFKIKKPFLNLWENEIIIGSPSEISSAQLVIMKEQARNLIPWKKGPFKLFGIDINAEWRSDLKWKRIEKHLPAMAGKNILDIGCNNGYFMFKMAAHNPAFVLGIDPVIHFHTQFLFLQKFAGIPHLFHELLGVEHLPLMNDTFDLVFSMGIIYHHRNPIKQLRDIRNCLKKNGYLILETMGVPGEDSHALFPEERYAGMKNVWFIPSLSCLVNWVNKSGFKNVKILSSLPLSSKEQRLTDWCPAPKKTLENFLDEKDQSKTIEGYPAPWRFCLMAER